MKTIENILETLTAEEREQNRELIEECLQREKMINDSGKTLRENVKKFVSVSEKFLKGINNYYDAAKELEDACQYVRENTDNSTLKAIPDENFFVC